MAQKEPRARLAVGLALARPQSDGCFHPPTVRLPKPGVSVALEQVPLFQGFCQLQIPGDLPLVSALPLGQVGAPAKRLPLGRALTLGQTHPSTP